MRLVKTAMRGLLGLLFIGAGVNHFVRPGFYTRLMPPYLPWHLELVYVSGVIEVALGALLLVPRYAAWAAWGLIALLIAFLPVHVHMAVNTHLYPDIAPALLWGRLFLQAVPIAWAYWFTRPGAAAPGPRP